MTYNKLHTPEQPSTVHKHAMTSDMLQSPPPVQNAILTQPHFHTLATYISAIILQIYHPITNGNVFKQDVKS